MEESAGTSTAREETRKTERGYCDSIGFTYSAPCFNERS